MGWVGCFHNIVIMVGLCLVWLPGMAAEVRIDGFASFAVGQMLSDVEGDDVGSISDDGSKYGYDEDFAFAPESRYGVQIHSEIGEHLSLTGQIVGKGEDDFRPEITWAFATYAFNDEWSVQVGRSRVPYFMYSDVLDVGYAYHWIRPPDSVYSLGFENQDGLTAEYLTEIGFWTSRLTLKTGRYDSEFELFDNTYEVHLTNQFGGAWSLEYSWFMARIAYFTSTVTIPIDEFIAAADAVRDYDAVLAAVVPGYELGTMDDLADDMLMDGDRSAFRGIGFSANFERYFGTFEYTEVEIPDSNSLDHDAWYITGGVRVKQFTFFATYEEQQYANKQTEKVEEFSELAPVTGIPELDGARTELLGAVSSIFGLKAGEKETALGVGLRYDFHYAASLKAEYNQWKYEQSGQRPKVLAVALDLVF